MNSEQQPPSENPPGGKAAERLREQLAKEFGDETPESVPPEVERSTQEPDQNAGDETNSPKD
jgi:hypothetical protein